DDTSKLKSLIPDWVNHELKPNPLVNPEDKFCHGFTNNACGRLLCPTDVKAGIRDRIDGYVVIEMSWPAFLYTGYTTNQDNLEEGLFKSKLLVQAFKAIFTSPSSTKEVTSNGDGTNIIENNRQVKKDFSGKKVKTHVVQIIKLQKVSPHLIAYVSCQVSGRFFMSLPSANNIYHVQLQFALSSVTSWQSINGNFDYIQFWYTIVDFFECPPS
ncbi:hypothetical protein BD769DRAFT_1364402, partial [Suillus cothurnatus]